MVLLHVKRDSRSLFLLSTTLSTPAGDALSAAVALHNGVLKVRRVRDELRDLAAHGAALPPEMRGLLEDQIAELRLRDEEGARCEPVGGVEVRRDELQRRGGRAPKDPAMREVLERCAAELDAMVREDKVEAGLALDYSVVTEALEVARGAVAVVYPSGLPSFDPLRMELENAEELLPDSYQAKQVLDPAEATLWFANKEMSREEPLSKYLRGGTERSKVVVKLSTKRSGQPASEARMSSQAEKELALANFKRMEELRRLERDDDDSYLNSPWADGAALKKKFQGLENVSWKP